MALGILFPDAQDGFRRATWKWVWPLLLAGFVLRLIVAYLFPYMAHPDEVFQYYEQAHRVVYGYGLVPWEYVYGIRSWIIPFGLAGLLETGRVLGLDLPSEYIPLVAVSLCFLSLVLPLGMYRLSQHLLDERGAIYAFSFGIFWWHFLFFAHKPMPGILATYALIWGCVLLYRPASRKNLVLLGLLAGSVLVLRYQLAPVVGVLGLFAVFRLGWRFWPAFASFSAVIVFAGLIDLWTWNGFLFSFFENFRLNFIYDISSVFSVSPWYLYFYEVTRQTGGLAVLSALGAIAIIRASWPLLVAVIVGAAALHIPAHKEFRFVLWALPFMFIGLAGGISYVTQRLDYGVKPAVVALTASAMAGTYVAAYEVNPFNTWKQDHLALRTIFLKIARENDVKGVELRTRHGIWWQTYGYYSLGHAVPIYFFDDSASSDGLDWADRSAHVSHIVIERGDEPPAGYELAFEDAGLETWRAIGATERYDISELELRASLPTPLLLDIQRRTPQLSFEATDKHPDRFK